MVKMVALFLFATFSSQLMSQEKEIGGWVRGSFYGGGKDYPFASLFTEASVKGSYRKDNAVLFADVRLRAGLNFGERYIVPEIKEAYAGYEGEKVTFLVGNQIINRSKTELFAPMGGITPINPFFLTCDPDDQRLSNFMVKFETILGKGVKAGVLLIPVYKESEYRFDLYNLGDGIAFQSPALPSKTLKNGSIAANLDFSFRNVDLSLTYFRGYDPDYGFKMLSFTPTGANSVSIENSAAPYLKNTVGANAEIGLGQVILRGEGAWNITEDYEQEIHIPYPSVEVAVGLETSILNTTILAEYSLKKTLEFKDLAVPQITDPTDPMAMLQYGSEMAKYEFAMLNRRIFRQQEEYNHAAGITLSRSFANDILKFDLTSLYNITSEEWLLRGAFEWRATDNLSATLGFNYLSGKEKTPYYYTKGIINAVFAQIKISF